MAPPWRTQQPLLIGESEHWVTKMINTHHRMGWQKGTIRRHEDAVTANYCLNASSPNNHSPDCVACDSEMNA